MDYSLLSKLRQCPHRLDTIQGHDEALQLPHILDRQSQPCLSCTKILDFIFLDFSQERVLVSQKILYEVFDRSPDISVRQDLHKILYSHSLIEVAGGSQVLVLYAKS